MEERFDLRLSKLLTVVENLFANHDDAKLDSQLEETAVGRTLIQSQTPNTLVVSWVANKAGKEI